MQKFSLRRASAVITDSESSRKDIIKYVGIRPEKISVVYLAAGEQFKNQKSEVKEQKLRTKYNLPEKFLLYVGDVTWNKNLPRLLDAVKKINVPLVMIGKNLVQEDYDKSNPWNQDLNRVNELARDDKNIIRLGFISMEELTQIYNLATVFIMPSLYEGFGLPILEAMACGCPVIASKEGSLPEIAGDAVFYVDAYNVENIAYGIERVLKDKKLQGELIEKGYQNLKKFSWEKTAEETLKVYRKVTK